MTDTREGPERIYAWTDRPLPTRGKWSAHPAGPGAAYVRADILAAAEAERDARRGEVDDLRECFQSMRSERDHWKAMAAASERRAEAWKHAAIEPVPDDG